MIQGKSIHYVMAAYFGPRRAEYAPQARDRMLFVRRHIESLDRLAHSLDRITIALQHNAFGMDVEQYDGLAELIASYTHLRDRVRVIVRPNDYGISYTALARVVRSPEGRQFDYTIFNEDDYVFTTDHFDAYLVDKLTRERAAYICGCERVYFDGISHAAVCSGIGRTDVLADSPLTYASSEIPQVAWSHALLKHGPIVDWLCDYATAYRLDNDAMRWIERNAPGVEDPFTLPVAFRRALLVPVQALDKIERKQSTEIMFWDGGYQTMLGGVTPSGLPIWGPP